MKITIEILRQILSYEQEAVDGLAHLEADSQEELLGIVRHNLSQKKTAGGYNLIDCHFDENKNLVLGNNAYWFWGPFCRVVVTP